MKLSGWRLAGVIAFGIFALMELGDWAGLMPGYANPAPYAALIGIAPDAERVRLLILTVLAFGVVVTASATVFALVRRAAWAELVARATAAVFVAYGMYQVVSALTQLGKNQSGIVVAGLVYALIGVLAAWLGSRAARAA